MDKGSAELADLLGEIGNVLAVSVARRSDGAEGEGKEGEVG
jgi:hypothetical protein